MVGLQYLENNFAIEFTYSLTSYFFSEICPVDRYFGVKKSVSRGARSLEMTSSSPGSHRLDQILQLADIPRPVVLRRLADHSSEIALARELYLRYSRQKIVD